MPEPAAAFEELAPNRFAAVVGALRGSSAEAQHAHAERLRSCPVPYRGFVLRDERGEVLACGQFAYEAELVGLYDIVTADSHRGRGLATWLCMRLLTLAETEAGSTIGYLQVGADNTPARRMYARLGFQDAYAYHYRMRPETEAR